MSEIMKIINEKEKQKTKDRKKQRSGASYSEVKWSYRELNAFVAL